MDGSLLPACSRLTWALWKDDNHRAAKMHVHFEVLRGIPVKVSVTAGVDSETVQLRQALTAGRLYVVDRGYAEYQLFQDIIDGGQFVYRPYPGQRRLASGRRTPRQCGGARRGGTE